MLGYKKGNKKLLTGQIPLHYPADRTYMGGNVNNDVETALSYSTDEHVVGKWIDGSVLYEKTVDCGALPNTTSKTVAHGISNISKIVEIKGYATNGTLYLPLPFAGSSATNGISIYAGINNISIETGMDRSNFDESYVTLRYTKTS